MRALQHVAHTTPYCPSFRSFTTPTSPPHPTHFCEGVAGPEINSCKRVSASTLFLTSITVSHLNRATMRRNLDLLDLLKSGCTCG